MDSVRLKRASTPANPCLRLETFREAFFAKVEGSRACADAFAGAKSWKLHYRLVRSSHPTLQFDALEGEGVTPELRACVQSGPLQKLVIPSEVAFLDGQVQPGRLMTPLSCHRLLLNITQDEFLEAKMRMPLMKVSVEPGEGGHWLDRLWLAPFMDRRGIQENWLLPELLPSGSCRLCLKDSYREQEPAPPGRP